MKSSAESSIGPSTPLEYAVEPEEIPPANAGAGRAIWALVDQGVVSLGNFGTLIILGRLLPPTEYGLFTILFDVIFFLNSLQSALIIYPLSVWGAKSGLDRLRRHTMASLGITSILGILTGVIGIAVGVATGHLAIAYWAAASTVLWQLQETSRRGLMAHLRFRDAIYGDAISYLGQAAGLALLAWRGHGVSLATTFSIMAATSTAGLLVQAWQLGIHHVSKPNLRKFGIDAWKLGQWAVYSNMLGLLTVSAYPWLVGIFHGLTNVALFGAYGSLMKLTNPLMTSMQGLIVPAAAMAASRGGTRAACRVALRYGSLGMCMLAPYYLVLILFPDKILWAIYKRPEYLHHNTELRLWILGYAAVFVGNILAALLNAIEQSRSAFVSQVVTAVSAALFSVPMTIAWGMFGAVTGGAITNLARVGALLYLLREPWRGQPGKTEPAPSAFPVTPASSAA